MRTIREITLRNMLSFGPDTPPLELRDLNVLIGPNGSGKSNLIEAFALLRAAPSNLAAPVRDGGGIRDWLWKGQPNAVAKLDVVVENTQGNQPLRHVIEFSESSQTFELVDERIENEKPYEGHDKVYFFYRYERGQPILLAREDKDNDKGKHKQRNLRREDVARDESILSQRKDPDQYPEITYLGQLYSHFRLYREWSFGRYTAPRQPQKADQPNEFLEPDATNLGLVLNRLERDVTVKRRLLSYLRELYDGIEDYYVSVEGGTVQVFFHESGYAIPATRLSDGTLRYLCLLAILCHPHPPPLVCIEEPELGLHPDIIPTVARLLTEASDRTQLVVTTHSDILVDALSETPDSVVVCEKSTGPTSMKRLDSTKLAKWLEKYRLGELWTSGEIGGVRW